MDLQDPLSKMSKTGDTEAGCIMLMDDPTDIARKFKRAVTDSGTEIAYDPDTKPGVSNLLSILAAARGGTPEAAAEGITSYGQLKTAAADAVIDELRPLQERYAELAADPGEVNRLLAVGAGKARAVAAKTLARAQHALGFLAPG
jgi:tryptophanyl-tRNA synthetase